MMSTDVVPDPYACAIGHAILALNTAEAEVFGVLEALGCSDPEVEASRFTDKVCELKKLAEKDSDAILAADLLRLAHDASELNDERNNFAHGLLWFDPFDGTHQRRWVKLVGPKPRQLRIQHDERSPEEIREIADNMLELADRAAELASRVRIR